MFMSYAATFKTFRPRTQSYLKLQLANLFAETEINELQQQEGAQVISPTYSTHHQRRSSGELETFNYRDETTASRSSSEFEIMPSRDESTEPSTGESRFISTREAFENFNPNNF